MSDESTSASRPENPPQDTDAVSRRRFLTGLSLGLGALGTALVGGPLAGFVMAPLVEQTRPMWRDVGALTDFPVGSTVKVTFEDSSPLPWSGVTARTAAWLRHESEGEFIAFTVNCSHLGCPVRWLEGANLFMCPCHGGVYYRNGDVAAGPPPAPLQRYRARVLDGKVQVEASPLPLVTAQRPDRGRCRPA